jgi:hypothetical protein
MKTIVLVRLATEDAQAAVEVLADVDAERSREHADGELADRSDDRDTR